MGSHRHSSYNAHIKCPRRLQSFAAELYEDKNSSSVSTAKEKAQNLLDIGEWK